MIRKDALAAVCCLVSLLLIGCGENYPFTLPEGDVIVSVPVGIDAAWTLTGPGGFTRDGTGDAEFNGLDLGDYRVTWSDADGFLTPPTETARLEAGGVIRFRGDYAVPGEITIRTTPSELDASWSLAGPRDYVRNGAGAATIDQLYPGDYTLTWDSREPWSTPPDSTKTLADGAALTFTGAYTFDGFPAATPDDLIVLFEQVYSGRLLGVYGLVLSDDLVFKDPVGDLDTYDQELAIANGLFTGQVGQGGTVISEISIGRLDAQDIWRPTAANDPIFGGTDSVYRAYVAEFDFHDSAHGEDLHAAGLVLFYAVNAGSAERPDYRILGIVDGTDADQGWSSVRDLFE